MGNYLFAYEKNLKNLLHLLGSMFTCL